jgi:hypothetical protein
MRARSLTVPLFAAVTACAGAPAARRADPPPAAADSGEVPAPGVTYAVEGYTKPAGDARCVVSNVAVPGGVDVPRAVTVKFAVYPDGGVGAFEFLTPVPTQLAQSLRRAIASCPWKPGRDPQGNPAAIWVIMPVRFR